MPRFAANLSLLFTEHDMPARFAAAARAGFTGVEMQFPYEWEAERLARARTEAGVETVLINVPAGDLEAGEIGLAALPDRVEAFRAGLPLARRYAEALGCRLVNVLAGKPGPTVPEALWRETLIDNLRFAAESMAEAGIRVVTEPLNDKDVPGFSVTRLDDALDLIGRVGHPNLTLQFDIYHRAVMEGDVVAAAAAAGAAIGHVQFADHPGRHEPGTGGLDFPAIFAALAEAGYEGWYSAEYRPSGRTEDGLAWLGRWTA